MHSGYFATAWADIRQSKGWFGKACLLALLFFIPVFGPIVVLGYLWGWSREIAWNVHKPLPEKIFGNVDGKLYRRGWQVLVVAIVFGLAVFVLNIFLNVLVGLLGGTAASVSAYNGVASIQVPVHVRILDSISSLIVTAAGFFVLVFVWVGAIRASIYDRISAGLQVKRLWSMIKHDTRGLGRILGMYVLVGLIFALIIAVISMVLTFIALAGGIAMYGPSLSSMPGLYGYGSSAAAAQVAMMLSPLFAVIALVMLVCVYFAFVGEIFMEMLVARAIGYWARQFDVAHWGGQNDPMPFERAPQPQAQPTYPVNPYGQAARASQQPMPQANATAGPAAGAAATAAAAAAAVQPRPMPDAGAVAAPQEMPIDAADVTPVVPEVTKVSVADGSVELQWPSPIVEQVRVEEVQEEAQRAAAAAEARSAQGAVAAPAPAPESMPAEPAPSAAPVETPTAPAVEDAPAVAEAAPTATSATPAPAAEPAPAKPRPLGYAPSVVPTMPGDPTGAVLSYRPSAPTQGASNDGADE